MGFFRTAYYIRQCTSKRKLVQLQNIITKQLEALDNGLHKKTSNMGLKGKPAPMPKDVEVFTTPLYLKKMNKNIFLL